MIGIPRNTLHERAMSYIETKRLQTSYYAALGVPANALLSDIKNAYKKRLLESHPDKTTVGANGSGKTGFPDSIAVTQIQEAYRVLSDENRRSDYDQSLKKSVQKEGFNLTGDGLDVYSLADFAESEEEQLVWRKACPRCVSENAIVLTEEDLAEKGTSDGQGGYELIVQCSACSLWIRVAYVEEEEE